MKRIYFFGRTIRISFLISFALLIYAMIYMYIQSNFDLKNLLLLVLVIIFVLCGLIWIYSMGVFVDSKKDKLRIVTGFLKSERIERVLSNVVSVDVELRGDIGMDFIINYKYNSSDKKIEYRFYRIAFVERLQYKRIKKQLEGLHHEW